MTGGGRPGLGARTTTALRMACRPRPTCPSASPGQCANTTQRGGGLPWLGVPSYPYIARSGMQNAPISSLNLIFRPRKTNGATAVAANTRARRSSISTATRARSRAPSSYLHTTRSENSVPWYGLHWWEHRRCIDMVRSEHRRGLGFPGGARPQRRTTFVDDHVQDRYPRHPWAPPTG